MKNKESILGMIANAAPMAGGDWEMIAPYGEFPTADRKKVQKFGRPQAEAMVATFNSLWHRLGTMFRGVPIFHGHPDVDPRSWPDDRRLGKIAEIEAREDGLWGKPEWNALGADNAREGWWLYPSPAWLHPRTMANTVEPDELLSIGLVNTPNIPGSLPWANSAEFAEDYEDDEEISTDDDTMKEKLIALLGMEGTATDDEIMAALEAKMTPAAAEANADDEAAAEAEKLAAAEKLAEAERMAMEANTARDAAEANAKAIRETFAVVVVDAAITNGKATEAERETLANSILADGADVKAVAAGILSKAPELNTGKIEIGGKTVTISSPRERQAAISTEVNSRMDAKGLTYDAAYTAVKKDPKFRTLFEAMQQPGAEG
jgi:hypothetical protein